MKESFGSSPVKLLASFFYLGYCPVMPGTIGTLGGVVLFLLLRFLAPGFLPEDLGELRAGYLIFLALFFLAGAYSAGRGEKIWREKDSPRIVIDEAFSFFITLFCIPFSAGTAIVGFILNRVFDVAKPFPIRRLEEKVPGGWGVMTDDLLAGIYGNLVLRLILFLFGR